MQAKPQQQQQYVAQPEPARNGNDNNGSSGTYLTGSCESNKNQQELEGGNIAEQQHVSAEGLLKT